VIDAAELASLESAVTRALTTGRQDELDVLGYGEITLVLGWPPHGRELACKRLPVFPGAAALDAYRHDLDEYLCTLRARGVDVVDTEVHAVPRADGSLAAYCVQRALPSGCVVPALLRAGGPPHRHPVLDAVAATVVGAVSPGVGLDAQLANWAWTDGRLRYFDVTTPMLLDDGGRPRLDLGLFLAALPWVVRAPVRRFVLPGVFARFTRPRAVLLDLLGNMLKERLAPWLPHALAAANEHVDPPLTAPEVRKFYAGDARLWRAMLAVRRADRWWQRRVRRRAYPFLLPPPIER
jgi:hypothetical protein